MIRYPRPITAFGRFVLLIQAMITRPERRAVLWARTMDEAMDIGIDSIFIVGLVATFIGAVTCIQIAYNMVNPFVPMSTVVVSGGWCPCCTKSAGRVKRGHSW